MIFQPGWVEANMGSSFMVFGTMREKTFFHRKRVLFENVFVETKNFSANFSYWGFSVSKKNSFRDLRRLFWLFILELWD